MTDLSKNPLEPEDDFKQPTELEVLKERAKLMGVAFSNNVGLETLRERINAKQSEMDKPSTEVAAQSEANPLVGEDTLPVEVKTRTPSLRSVLLAEQTKLVRVRITNMDPKKKDLPGEIITVANDFIGTIRKYVPYGEQTDNGYHIPKCIYEFLKNREFLDIKVVKKNNGRLETKTRYVREFAIEVLPQLTDKELSRLAATQAARGDQLDDE